MYSQDDFLRSIEGDLIHENIRNNKLDFFKNWKGTVDDYILEKKYVVGEKEYYILKDTISKLTMVIELNEEISILRDLGEPPNEKLIEKCSLLNKQGEIDIEGLFLMLFGVDRIEITEETRLDFQVLKQKEFTDILSQVKKNERVQVLFLFAENKTGWKITIKNGSINKIEHMALLKIVVPNKYYGIR